MLLSVQNFDRTYSKSVIRGSYTFYHISRRGWKAANIKNKLRCSSLYSLLFEWSIHSKVRVTLQRSIKHFWQWKRQTTKIVIASLQFQKKWYTFIIWNYIQVLKVFPVLYLNRYQGWKWMETFKKDMAHLNYPAKSTPEKATVSLLRLLLPNEICLILSS